MNVAAATTAYAATTYDLCLVPSLAIVEPTPAPSGTFVSKLVASLAASFPLDTREQVLAELLLFGRSLGAISRQLGVDTREVQRRCAELFAATCSDGRQQLFEIGLRLTTMRELSNHLLARA